MATNELGVTSLPAAAIEPVILKRNSDDVGWQYGVLVDSLNKEKVQCLFCGHCSSGGIYHLKQHVGHVGSSVAMCKKTTPEAKEKCKKSLEEATRKRNEKTACGLNLREEVNISKVGEEDEVTCVGSGVESSEPHKLGPIDKWTRAIDPKATHAESFKQQKINQELWKQRTHEMQQYVARWMYTHGNQFTSISVLVSNLFTHFCMCVTAIPFNAINNDKFQQMCEAIGQFGPGFQPPTQEHVRGPLLTEEYERTKSLVQGYDDKKMKNGCSIMTDA
jgi:hypothetical protein